MDFAVKRLKTMSCRKIKLWVLEENTGAKAFYEKYGFVPDGSKRELTLGKPLTELRYKNAKPL